jgi:hypothetical protein
MGADGRLVGRILRRSPSVRRPFDMFAIRWSGTEPMLSVLGYIITGKKP